MGEAETPFPEYEPQVDLVAEEIAPGRNRVAALAGLPSAVRCQPS